MIEWLSITVAAVMVAANLAWHQPGCQIVIASRSAVAPFLHPPEHLVDWVGESDSRVKVCGGVTRERALALFDLTHPCPVIPPRGPLFAMLRCQFEGR